MCFYYYKKVGKVINFFW